MNKIIFLDIDGVIATKFKEIESDRRCKFECHLVDNLNTLVEKTNAKIVISSTWRMGQTVESMRNIFKLRGFKYSDVIIDFTPRLRDESYIYRGNEIQAWINKNIEYDARDDFNFCIIDDDSDMLLWHSKYFVKTNTREGLTIDKMNEVITILNGR